MFNNLPLRITIFICCSILIFITCEIKSSNHKKLSVNVDYIPYYLKVYEADSLALIGDFKKSFQILDSLFTNYEPIHIEGYYEYYTYISSAYASKNFTKGKEMIKNAFSNYGAVISHFRADSILSKALDSSGFSDSDLNILIESYNVKLNLDLRRKVEDMIYKDKLVRKNNSYPNFDSIQFINQENTLMIKKIFNEKGYPSNKLIGYYSYNDKDIDIGAVLLHTDLDFKRDYLLPKLRSYVKMGTCQPAIYANIYDRVLLDESNFDGKQMFGQFNGKNIKLINSRKIDSIRKASGLPSYGYENWRFQKQFGNVKFN